MPTSCDYHGEVIYATELRIPPRIVPQHLTSHASRIAWRLMAETEPGIGRIWISRDKALLSTAQRESSCLPSAVEIVDYGICQNVF